MIMKLSRSRWLLPILLFCLPAIHAGAEPKSFIVNLLNGESVIYNLSERPILTFADGKMKVKTYNMESEFELVEIAKSEFSEIVAVETMTDDTKTTSFDITTDHILISGANRADVFDTTGKLMLRCNSGQDKTIDIDTSTLQPGIYVIYTPTRSIKYTK